MAARTGTATRARCRSRSVCGCFLGYSAAVGVREEEARRLQIRKEREYADA